MSGATTTSADGRPEAGSSATRTADEDVEQQFPQVFSAWFHPEKSWKDRMVGFMCSWFFPIRASDAEETVRLRRSFDKAVETGLESHRGAFRIWAASVSCDIVQVMLQVPRNDSLFQEWGILKPNETLVDFTSSSLPQETNITVQLSFPVTLLPDSVEKPTHKNKFGCLELEANDDILKKLPADTPLVLYFHGGGLTIGNALMSEGIELLNEAYSTPSHDDDDNGDPTHKTKTAVIFASVEYSLAPEHPFPVAPLEACSVVSYFLDEQNNDDRRPLHLIGVSAGANLALVSGLEAYRAHRNKHNIRSMLIACPFLDPATDSVSYYQNSASSHLAPVPWLRYCWQAYLDLAPPAPIGEAKDDGTLTVHDILGRDSNRKAWNESKWKASSLCRLVNPAVDLPKHLPPQIIVTTNSADPLLDEGLVLVKKLRQIDNTISYKAYKGSHWLGTSLDKTSFRDLAVAWSKAIFGE